MPRLRADQVNTILVEPELDLSLEDVQRLAVADVDVGRSRPPAARRAHVDDGELLEVGEERHLEHRTAEDDLACADLDHGHAA